MASDTRRGLAWTLVLGFIVHALVALVGLVVLPLYLDRLGAESYGLVGFFTVLQGWILLFDLGLSPAVGRQLSRFRGGAMAGGQALGLARAAEIVFLLIALALGVVLYLGAHWMGRHWLGAAHLSDQELIDAMRLGAALVIFRWLAGLYQTALVGLERQNLVNAISLIGAIVRSAVSVAVLYVWPPSPTLFFAAQAGFTLLEALVFRLLLFRSLPKGERARGGWRRLGDQARFAAGLAASAVLATAISQTDKLALSHVLPLGEFGLFSLVASIRAGIALVIPPVAQAIQPRLTLLLTEGRRGEFIALYRLSLAVMVILTAALAGTIGAQPEMTLYGWTGRRDIAAHLAPVLSLYALGSGLAALLYAPFMLQYAEGRMKLQWMGTLVFAALWIPAAIVAAQAWGALGAAWVWFLGNLVFVMVWVPWVHVRLLAPAERRGLLVPAAGLTAALAIPLAASRLIRPESLDRLGSLLVLAVLALGVGALGLIVDPETRAEIGRFAGLGRAGERRRA
jgi:O-antigen/teichoic acid export membrane protein